ncbi:hypothetical protein Tco_0625510 [Tanacetum coccineum]|uniref:Uncharacterized protein n=1 Tax=Tanacetum coccineum TaxID=301880 RepID=A0ABQ4WH38_9ASTR
MNQVPQELVQVVVPRVKKPWGIKLLRLGLRMYLNIPIFHYTARKEVNKRVLALETTKTTQALNCKFERRDQKARAGNKSRTHGDLKKLNIVGSSRRVNPLKIKVFGLEKDASQTVAGEEVFVVEQSGNVVEEVVDVIDAASTIPVSAAIITDDKDKGIMIEQRVVEQVKPMKRLEQMTLDEELAFKLQAEEEEERLAREKAQQIEEANISWDDVQAKQRRKYFAAKRAEEKRNRPPIRAQQRNIMVKTFVDYKTELVEESSKKAETELEDNLKKPEAEVFCKSFFNIKTELVEESSKKAETELEDNLKKPEAEVMEGSSKRAGEELEQESIKKQKLLSLQLLLTGRFTKKERKAIIKILKADGKSQMYRVFSQMLKSFSREDLEDLYKLVKAKYGSTRPVEDLDLILYGDLKTMFEPHVEDQVWKNQDDYNLLD